MSRCIEERFENMIYAYELDLLDDNEKNEFELHLYKCAYCFEKVQKFQKTAQLLRRSPNVRRTVNELAGGASGETPESRKHTFPRKRLWPALVPVSIAAVFFIFLLLKDWQFEVRPSQEAVASENRLAIMYFENLGDPRDSLKIGEIAANLLIADLSESHYLNIVSSQRLYDILGLIGQEDTKIINRETATRVAIEADARWILMGSILQTFPQIILTTQLIEISSGDVLASQRITGEPGKDIFSAIDQLTIQIKNDLKLPAEALMEPDPQVADFTTHSSEAYRYYLAGVEDYQKFYWLEARANFEEALKYDSTFAMAYYYLASLVDKELIYKALQYADNTGRIDRYYIEIFEASYSRNDSLERKLLAEVIRLYPDEKDAYYMLGNLEYVAGEYEKAIEAYNRAIKIDPRFKTAYNQLVYTYNAAGNFEKALWAIDKYIELAPDEANPFDTKGDLYALNGMLDNAIESYKRALIIKPDFYASLLRLSLMYIFDTDYNRADSCLNILLAAEKNSYQDLVPMYKGYISLFQGKFGDALGQLDIAINTAAIDLPSYHFIKAHIYTEKKNWEMAIKEIDKTIELYSTVNPNDKVTYRYFRIQILAESGDLSRARELMKELEENVQKGKDNYYAYWYASGSIELARGDFARAAEYFEEMKKLNRRFFACYMAARAYLLAGRINDAITEFEYISNQYTSDRAYTGIWSIKLYYYLGLAYEKSGQQSKAIEQFKTFIDIWKNADPGINEIEDAGNRLERLQNQS